MKKFKKKRKNKYCILLIVVFTVLVSILIGRSYALYKKETEVTFINAKVRWPRADEVGYATANNANVTNVSEALNDLYEKLGE